PRGLDRTDRRGHRVEIRERAALHAVGGAGLTGQALQPREVDGHRARRHTIELGLDRRVARGDQHAEARHAVLPAATTASVGITRRSPTANVAIAARTRSRIATAVFGPSSASMRPIRIAPAAPCDQYSPNDPNSIG